MADKKLTSRIANSQQIANQKKQEYDKKITEAMQEVALTDAGIVVLTHIRKVCGFGEPNTIKNLATNDLAVYSTVYNNAQENIYKSLRKYMSKKTKIRIEIND